MVASVERIALKESTDRKSSAFLFQNVVEQIRKEQNEMKENVRTLRQKVKVMEAQNNRIESMLTALLKHHNIDVETHEA